MLKWWRRNDGFKWKEYVRTTVLVRRARRKAHVENAVAAAASGARAAGAAAAAGAGKAASKAGEIARAGGQSIAGMAGKAGEAMRPLAARSADAARPVADVLARPSVSRPLALVAALALIAAAIRIVAAGPDRQALGALAVGVAALLLSYGPRWMNGNGPRVPAALGQMLSARRGLAIAGGTMAALAVAAFAIGRGPSMNGILASLPSVPAFAARTVEGRASVVAGDMIRLDGSIYRLTGIEAPEREQRCAREGGRTWPCGKAAEQALVKLVRGRTLSCDVRGSDEAGRPTAACRDGKTDINQAMVKGGHAFASQGMLSQYAAAEQEARRHKTGIWKGEAERPSQYRARAWDEAKRRSPDGCPIKGQVTAGGKQYVVPGASDYARRTVQRQRGDRWFCSEQDAIAAGFKAAERG